MCYPARGDSYTWVGQSNEFWWFLYFQKNNIFGWKVTLYHCCCSESYNWLIFIRRVERRLSNRNEHPLSYNHRHRWGGHVVYPGDWMECIHLPNWYIFLLYKCYIRVCVYVYACVYVLMCAPRIDVCITYWPLPMKHFFKIFENFWRTSRNVSSLLDPRSKLKYQRHS